MKDGILMFALALLLGGLLYFNVKRNKEEKSEHKESQEILKGRLKGKIKPVLRADQSTALMENTGYMPEEIDQLEIDTYPYHQKERRTGQERRKSREQNGIIFKYVDRRKADSAQYTGFDRRIGKERRGKIWDRRKPTAFRYSY